MWYAKINCQELSNCFWRNPGGSDRTEIAAWRCGWADQTRSTDAAKSHAYAIVAASQLQAEEYSTDSSADGF